MYEEDRDKINAEIGRESEPRPAPYTYERTYDKDKAQFVQNRQAPNFFGEKNEPFTDNQIVEIVQRQKENENWHTVEYWRDKGLPEEQVNFTVNGREIRLYNFDSDNLLSDEQVETIESLIQRMSSRFPQAIDNLNYILIDDVQMPSAFGDPDKLPANGEAKSEWKSFRFFPRGLSLQPHRIPEVSNLEGTFVHELSHLIDEEVLGEWNEHFSWGYCSDYPDEWEVRKTPDDSSQRWFNKTTGEMSLWGRFPLQEGTHVSEYARANDREDFAESMVAYMLNPDYLKEISPTKFELISQHDANMDTSEVSFSRVNKDEIELPKIEPQTVLYYINEPKEE